VPRDGVPDMARAHAYYERLTCWFTRHEIERGLEAVEGNQSPRSRTLIGKLDAIEGKYLLRYAQPVEPRSVSPSDDWPGCT
jgi:hypothetical protein